MKPSTVNLIGSSIICAALGTGIGTAIGESLANTLWQIRAVNHGAATWIVDKYGNPEFKWNDELKKKVPAADPPTRQPEERR